MSKIQVLVVDDEPRYLKLVCYNLEAAGYEVTTAASGEEALSLVTGKSPDLIILDIRLPGIDGYEVCSKIREFSSIPIIMLTAKGEEREKVQGLRLGADDYITKPFGAEELMARVENALRRSRIAEAKALPTLSVGELSIDFMQRKVTIEGQEVSFSPIEYRLLQYLAIHAGRVIVQEELQEKVWGPEYREHYEGLRVYIRRLRQKIEKDPEHPILIITKPGVGYMLAPPS
ncbi:MAG: response regulator transcription factor [Candidatus Binatia bacterium]